MQVVRSRPADDAVHPAYTGLTALPFIDSLDWSTVNALLITQCVPYTHTASIWTMRRR